MSISPANQPTTDQAREDVIAVVSHDLRGPLGAIQVALEALGNPELTAAQRARYHAAIRQSTERATQLLQDLADANLIETGGFVIEERPVRPAALLTQVVQENARLAETYGMKLEPRLSRAPEMVRADRDRMLQALSHIIRFSLQHARGRGPVELHALERGASVVLVVRDHGPGLPAGSEDRIFERFWSHRPRASGSYLGMAIARGIVEAHGGVIRAGNDPDGGARFEIELPVTASANVSATPA